MDIIEGRQKCQEKVTARNKYSISSGKSKLPLRVARVLGRQYERSVSPTTLIIGGDVITVESTSIRQKDSRS
jgi:hypothetical protein